MQGGANDGVKILESKQNVRKMFRGQPGMVVVMVMVTMVMREREKERSEGKTREVWVG